MKNSFSLLIACGIFAACLFSSCEKEVKVSGIIVEPKSLFLNKGDVAQLAYMVTPYGAENKSVKWTSDNTSIATVSQTGLVTAIGEGETKITATTNDGHFTDVVAVTVMRGSPAGDSIALVKFYEIATDLPWDLTKPMNTWEGVVLNSHRRVVQINSNYSIFISKPLDASIGNLTCLKSLYLQVDYSAPSNITIPAEIGLLTDLQDLLLGNGFTGSIPSELGNLVQLKDLYIYNNPLLTGSIPKELGNLINLELLALYSNQLTGGIPHELGNLVKLEQLYMRDNKLTGEIPQELENLKCLIWMDLYNNSLSGTIPQSLLDQFGGWSFCPQNGTNFDNLDCDNWW